MPILTRLANTFFASRLKQIDRFCNQGAQVQRTQLRNLLRGFAGTALARRYGLDGSETPERFREKVPVGDYEAMSGLIERTRRGEQGLFTSERVRWFAKSSGTTGAKSKFIPVTGSGLRESHMRGPRDVMAFYCRNYPQSKVLNGKMLTLGGSRKIEQEGDRMQSGDLSAILISHTPQWAEWRRVPTLDVAMIPDFEEKVRKICEQGTRQNISSFTGVPSWNLVMMNKVLEYTGCSNLLEVWPNLELFVHGGMNFGPYREQYRKLIPTDAMHYMETYNASEGFFSIADDPRREDMLLMLDYGTYYEFLPVAHLDDPRCAVPLEGVQTGVNYAMIITTSNGLWRYQIGDTVEFTSVAPYRIRITGRTKHYVNAFGEEIIVDNAEAAIHAACLATGAEVAEFTVAPVYMEGNRKGSHEWVIEFHHAPADLARFAEALDRGLQQVNSDYEAKRFNDTTLYTPRITVVPPGTFLEWMRARGRIGGQHKVPRLYNDRTFVESLLALHRETSPMRKEKVKQPQFAG